MSKIVSIQLEVYGLPGPQLGNYETFKMAELMTMWPDHRERYLYAMEYIHHWETVVEDHYRLPRGSCKGLNMLFETPRDLVAMLRHPTLLAAVRDTDSRVYVHVGPDRYSKSAWIVSQGNLIRLK